MNDALSPVLTSPLLDVHINDAKGDVPPTVLVNIAVSEAHI